LEAWAEITGLKAELVGEEICLLSGVQNQDFAEGCRSASAFLAAQLAQEDLAQEDSAEADLSALWSLFFESRVGMWPGDGSWVNERRRVEAKAQEGRS
jgi:hypothetical protein